MPFVYSTLAAPVAYTIYSKSGGDMYINDRSILIKGGTGVVDKNLMTPHGVVTEVTDEEMAILLEHPVFIEHTKNGFVTFHTKRLKVEKVVDKHLNSKDISAALTDADLEKRRVKPPIIGNSE